MSDDQKPKRFGLDKPQTSFTLRDMDNVQPRLRPKGLTLDHPRLAPPGMSGIKTQKPSRTHHTKIDGVNINVSVHIGDHASRGTEALKPSARPTLTLGAEGEAKRAFTPLVTKPLDKGRSR